MDADSLSHSSGLATLPLNHFQKVNLIEWKQQTRQKIVVFKNHKRWREVEQTLFCFCFKTFDKNQGGNFFSTES